MAYILKREGQPVAVDLGEATAIEHTLSGACKTGGGSQTDFIIDL